MEGVDAQGEARVMSVFATAIPAGAKQNAWQQRLPVENVDVIITQDDLIVIIVTGDGHFHRIRGQQGGRRHRFRTASLAAMLLPHHLARCGSYVGAQ